MNKTEVLIHPVRLSILQYLCIHKKATTSEIISSLPAVSKASIYNHIRLLEQNQIIEVVQENRIRGTIEKIYSLKKVAKNNDFNAILTFLLSLLSDFQKYYEKEPDPTKDMLFAGRDYLLLTDAEYQQFIQDHEKLCQKYYRKNSPGAKLRNISIISAPVNEKEKEELDE